MSISCRGKKDDRYQILETDPNVLLVFEGPDAGKFQQVDPPLESDPNTKRTAFSLEVDWLNEKFPGLLNEANHEQLESPSGVCVLGSALELFHHDFHDECRAHSDDAAESYKLYQEFATNYLPRLSRSQFIQLLGALVFQTYKDDPRLREAETKQTMDPGIPEFVIGLIQTTLGSVFDYSEAALKDRMRFIQAVLEGDEAGQLKYGHLCFKEQREQHPGIFRQ